MTNTKYPSRGSVIPRPFNVCRRTAIVVMPFDEVTVLLQRFLLWYLCATSPPVGEVSHTVCFLSVRLSKHCRDTVLSVSLTLLRLRSDSISIGEIKGEDWMASLRLCGSCGSEEQALKQSVTNGTARRVFIDMNWILRLFLCLVTSCRQTSKLILIAILGWSKETLPGQRLI